jgi:hypothetical protein
MSENELKQLQERAQALETQIQDIDDEMERCVQAIGAGDDPRRTIAFLRDRFNAQLGYMYDLGKVEARLEDFANRAREQGDLEREEGVASALIERLPLAPVDYLDWLRPDLEEPDQEHRQEDHDRRDEGEERMLTEMHRDDVEPEEYRDFYRR